jgi:hypothetical protein
VNNSWALAVALLGLSNGRASALRKLLPAAAASFIQYVHIHTLQESVKLKNGTLRHGCMKLHSISEFIGTQMIISFYRLSDHERKQYCCTLAYRCKQLRVSGSETHSNKLNFADLSVFLCA